MADSNWVPTSNFQQPTHTTDKSTRPNIYFAYIRVAALSRNVVSEGIRGRKSIEDTLNPNALHYDALRMLRWKSSPPAAPPRTTFARRIVRVSVVAHFSRTQSVRSVKLHFCHDTRSQTSPPFEAVVSCQTKNQNLIST